jgi:hypothetical protein
MKTLLIVIFAMLLVVVQCEYGDDGDDGEDDGDGDDRLRSRRDLYDDDDGYDDDDVVRKRRDLYNEEEDEDDGGEGGNGDLFKLPILRGK